MNSIRNLFPSMIAALLPASVWAAEASAEPFLCGPYMMMWGGDWPGMIFGPLLMILMPAAVIASVVFLVRWIGTPWHGAPWHGAPSMHGSLPGRAPVEILKERFARGEIDKVEFEERRRVLGD